MFAVAAVILGGFTLYNLAGTKTSTYMEDPQKRLTYTEGDAHQKFQINENLASYMAPLLEYPTKWMATYTMHRKVKAKLDQQSADYGKQVRATNDITYKNLRRNSPKMLIGTDAQISFEGYAT